MPVVSVRKVSSSSSPNSVNSERPAERRSSIKVPAAEPARRISGHLVPDAVGDQRRGFPNSGRIRCKKISVWPTYIVEGIQCTELKTPLIHCAARVPPLTVNVRTKPNPVVTSARRIKVGIPAQPSGHIYCTRQGGVIDWSSYLNMTI
jgi:hypothetical protein